VSGIALGIVLVLLIWGTLAGLDLVSVPQAMLSRPLVAATVAGAILGDVDAGLRVGAVLELFALDVLPVGAVRYPDYGPASVGAAGIAAGAPWELSLGVAVGIGILLATVGGWSLLALRRLNAAAVQRHTAALRSGDSRVIRRLHYAALARDAARSAVLTALALGAAGMAVRWLRPDRETAVALTIAAVGAGAASALGGALRGAGAGSRRRWLAVGGAVGTVVGVTVWGLR
jgi:mannose/fructose/N-acetylgalactosamine-specific phosphotransferase system component IIC